MKKKTKVEVVIKTKDEFSPTINKATANIEAAAKEIAKAHKFLNSAVALLEVNKALIGELLRKSVEVGKGGGKSGKGRATN